MLAADPDTGRLTVVGDEAAPDRPGVEVELRAPGVRHTVIPARSRGGARDCTISPRRVLRFGAVAKLSTA